jgi:hypothetical protein
MLIDREKVRIDVTLVCELVVDAWYVYVYVVYVKTDKGFHESSVYVCCNCSCLAGRN